jgi:CheY-like chemotaxis protein
VSAEEDRTGGRSEVTIRVRDEGAGIPAGMLASIFDLFVQAENPAGRGREGLGLGLTLAERLVELQQGRIEAFSPGPGFGSEFVVRLPFAHPPRAPAAIAEAASAQRAANARRVLIVDDNLDSALSMSLLLRQAGHETLQVHTGSEAVEAALRFNPRAVLLDIGLPDMDGHEVARLMREEPALDGALVIAVTGYGREQDMAESRAAGIDAHLVKPVDMDRVFELVAAGRKPRASSET